MSLWGRLDRLEGQTSTNGLDRSAAYATIRSELGHKFGSGYIACCLRVVGHGSETRWAHRPEGRVPNEDEILVAQYWKWVDRFGETAVEAVLKQIKRELTADLNAGTDA